MLVVMCCSDIGAQNKTRSFPDAKRSDLVRPPFQSLVRKARLLESISYRVGFTLEPGEFRELSEECLRIGSQEDFKSLLKDVSPIIRVLGLICLAKTVGTSDFVEIAKPLYFDFTVVKYTNGCVLNQSGTVGTIAKELAEGRFFLVPEKRVM